MSAAAGLIIVVFFSIGWLTLYVFRAEGLTEALPSYAGAERFWVQLTPAILTVHVTVSCVTIQRASVSPWAGLLAVAVFATAVGFWFWGRAMIGPLRRRRLPDEAPQRFRQDGAFGVVRHPLYFSYVLLAAAPLVVVPRLWLCLTFALSFIAIAVRAQQEEQRLHQQLGPQYAAYCRKVKRLIPFVW